MNFDQLIENEKHFFFQKSYAKFGAEASPRAFYKKTKLSISLDQQSEML